MKSLNVLARLLFTGCLCLMLALAPSYGHAQEKKLRILVWGTTWETALKSVSEEFTQKTGVPVEVVTQTTGGESLIKLQAMKGKPTIDVWFAGESVAVRGTADKELFADYPVKDMPSWSQIPEAAKKARYVAVYQYPLSIVYRPDLIPSPPRTWTDLWDPKYKGLISIPGISVYQARMLLLAAALNGGGVDNIDPGFKSLVKLKPNIGVIYGGDAQARQLLAKGEVGIIVAPPSRAKQLIDQGVEAKVVTPAPAPMNYDVVTILKGTGNEAIAARYVDFILSKDANQKIAKALNMAPTNVNSEVPEMLKPAMPKASDMLSFDEQKVNENMGAWTERFQREVAN